MIIDASHDNSIYEGVRNPLLQQNVIMKTFSYAKNGLSVWPDIKGFMLESFLLEGNQPMPIEGYKEYSRSGLSITDPCLGWNETESLILKMAEML